MKTPLFVRSFGLLAALLLLVSACRPDYYAVDPYTEVTESFAVTGFDRLEAGSALRVTVRQGNYFRVLARGDQRDVADLLVVRDGRMLRIDYATPRTRRYETRIDIVVPYLRSVAFSGASTSEVLGFYDLDDFDVHLSGASSLRFVGAADLLYADAVGASELYLEGDAYELSVGLDGASYLDAFSFPVQETIVEASGASRALVRTGRTLAVRASGASTVWYRGNPAVQTQLSGGSAVLRD
jgi:hypothetical protein